MNISVVEFICTGGNKKLKMVFKREILKFGSLRQLFVQSTSFIGKCLTVNPFKMFELKYNQILSKSRNLISGSISKSLMSQDHLSTKGIFKVPPQFLSSKRFSHTDLKVPNFDDYRRNSVKNPKESSFESSYNRRLATYIPITLGIMGTVYGAKVLIVQCVSIMSASAEVLAIAQIEVKLSDIPEGKNYTIKWRGKPVFIRHRTQAQIDKERSVPLSDLRDPATDEQMATRPEWLVVIGVCTHLGCVPIADAGDYGGYYCPCHGSHYDYAGRIRRGPAPTNLEIPPHVFLDDENIQIG